MTATEKPSQTQIQQAEESQKRGLFQDAEKWVCKPGSSDTTLPKKMFSAGQSLEYALSLGWVIVGPLPSAKEG